MYLRIPDRIEKQGTNRFCPKEGIEPVAKEEKETGSGKRIVYLASRTHDEWRLGDIGRTASNRWGGRFSRPGNCPGSELVMKRGTR